MALLKALTEDQPPLAPEPALRSVREAYDRFLRQPPAYANEIEDTIVAYGRVLWPYRKAFDAMVRADLVRNEEQHFVSALSAGLRERFREWRHDGGSLLDLLDQHRVSSRFSATERGALCEALITARHRAEDAVRAAVIADGAEYQRLIREFQALQHEIEQHIASLRRLAERAADHPDVFQEIIETIRTFERGLAHLAREPEARDVCAAIEAYRERHAYLKEARAEALGPKIFR
ncbi:hypothetical protein HY634_01670 [Candidatus Uhrbacteria bacterium]|nr:hypothetical protein [Candidatus Uhrbacteria bacterium]